MSVKSEGIETLNELKIWIGGQFELVREGQKVSGDALRSVRERLHEISNLVSSITALDIPGKIANMTKTIVDHEDDIALLTKDMATNKGAKAAYAIAGTAVGSIITIFLELAKVIRP